MRLKTISEAIKEAVDTNSDHIENWIKKRFKKNPEFLYHLTSNKTLNDIKKNGLKTASSKQHKFDKGIYLADSIYTASNYSFLDDDKSDYSIIEIPFGLLSINKMRPDDYEMLDLFEDDYADYKELLDSLGVERGEVYDNSKHIYDSLDYRYSLFVCGQLLYIDNIKPDKFSKIYSKKDAEKAMKGK